MRTHARRSLCVLAFLSLLILSACDSAFQNNPHGPSYVLALTPVSSAPSVPISTALKPPAHLSPFGFGASLAALVAHYGQPTPYSAPPLYAFHDGNDTWPKGSLVVVTMKNNRAVEFAYDPGTDHPMTYQEAQDFAVQLLPDDVQGPKTVQLENDHTGKCLAKTYQSPLLKALFPPNDFISPDGKDTADGSVTLNLYPDAGTNEFSKVYSSDAFGSNTIVSTNQVNSVLLNLGSQPSC